MSKIGLIPTSVCFISLQILCLSLARPRRSHLIHFPKSIDPKERERRPLELGYRRLSRLTLKRNLSYPPALGSQIHLLLSSTPLIISQYFQHCTNSSEVNVTVLRDSRPNVNGSTTSNFKVKSLSGVNGLGTQSTAAKFNISTAGRAHATWVV